MVTKRLIERRAHRRHSANYSVFHVGGDSSGYAYTRDISEGGAFIETKHPAAIGTLLDIEIFLDLGNEVCPLSAKAEVMWSSQESPGQKAGMGLRFISMEEAAQKALQRAIARLARK